MANWVKYLNINWDFENSIFSEKGHFLLFVSRSTIDIFHPLPYKLNLKKRLCQFLDYHFIDIVSLFFFWFQRIFASFTSDISLTLTIFHVTSNQPTQILLWKQHQEIFFYLYYYASSDLRSCQHFFVKHLFFSGRRKHKITHNWTFVSKIIKLIQFLTIYTWTSQRSLKISYFWSQVYQILFLSVFQFLPLNLCIFVAYENYGIYYESFAVNTGKIIQLMKQKVW